MLRTALPPPRVFAGYSVGELAAYGCADALSVEATVELAAFRATVMSGACPDPCGMAAVRGLPQRRLEPLAAEHAVEIAIVNGADRFVVGGRSDGLARMTASASALGASVTPLPVHVASHTSLMAPATPAFRRRLEDGQMVAPKVPVLAGIDGTPVYQRRAGDRHAVATDIAPDRLGRVPAGAFRNRMLGVARTRPRVRPRTDGTRPSPGYPGALGGGVSVPPRRGRMGQTTPRSVKGLLQPLHPAVTAAA